MRRVFYSLDADTAENEGEENAYLPDSVEVNAYTPFLPASYLTAVRSKSVLGRDLDYTNGTATL